MKSLINDLFIKAFNIYTLDIIIIAITKNLFKKMIIYYKK